MEQRISLVTLGVSDMAKSRRFYESLGWKASAPSNDGVTFFQAGGLILGLYGARPLAEDAGIAAGDASKITFSLAYNVREKEDVDSVIAEAEKAGATITKPAEEKFWGGYGGYFTDPDGHPWEVAWNPGFPIAEDGSISLPR